MITNVLQAAGNISVYSQDNLPPVFQGIWPSLIVTIGALITLGIIVMVVSYLVYFPATKYIDERKKFIKSNLDQATKMNSDAQELLATANAEIKSAHKNAKKIVDESKNIALKEKQDILDEAKHKADKILKDTKVKMEQEVVRTKKELQQDMIDISILAAEKVLREKINTQQDQELIKKYLKDIDEK